MDSSLYNIPTADLFTLKERTILVTGGLGGLGAPLMISILESGGDVICFDLPTAFKDLDKFHLIALQNKTQFTYHPLDVTSQSETTLVFARAIKDIRFPLRGVVTAAGISANMDALEYPADVFKKVMEVNVLGSFLVVREAAKWMMGKGEKAWPGTGMGGSIVFIASMSGSVANKGIRCSAYNASKAAVLQLTRSLAAEWGNSPDHAPIRVNSLSPGYIYTAMSAVNTDKKELRDIMEDGCMLGRISHPEEYRAPLLFLLGDGSSFMTGFDLICDGGHCAW